MRNVAPGWWVAASLVCAGLLAGAAAGQAMPEHPVKAAAWPPAYQAETDVATLEQELRDAQARVLALRTRAAKLAKASQQAEAKDAELQADAAEQVARAIQARILVVKGSAGPLAHPPQGEKVGAVATGIEPAPPHEKHQAVQLVGGAPAAVAPVEEPPPPPAPAAADPDATLARDSAQIDALVQGSAAVSAPDKGSVGNSFIVYLRVSPDKLATVLAQLKADHPEDAVQKGQGIRLTPRMTATASGEGFDVWPKEGQVQAVSSTQTTEWQWQVTPTTSGVHTLSVTLTGSLIVQGQDTPRTFLAANQPIEVPISIANFFQQNWQWLVSTLAVPAIGALWAVFRKRTQEGAVEPAVRRGGRTRRTDGA